MQRKIIHIDMDAFYASVEQRDNPHLKGKPVAVGGSPHGRGVVAAASYEARRFGVRSALPMKTAVKLCPGLQIVRPRIPHYAKISKAIMAIYREYTDLIEPLSLDECFLDVSQNKKNILYATSLATQLKQRIWKQFRLTASAGVAPNKFLAKIASDMQKPDGLTVVKPHKVLAFLQDLPVNKVSGIGKRTYEKLLRMGIRTVGNLADISEEELTSRFGKVGRHFFRLARGVDDRPVQPFHKRKSISQERTFREDIDDFDLLKQQLELLADKVIDTIYKKRMKGSTVTLKLRYEDFQTITRSHTLPFPTDEKGPLLEHGIKLLSKTEAGQRKVRLLGIGMSNLIEINEIKQLMLFDPNRLTSF
jgi:DNA polymerase-4